MIVFRVSFNNFCASCLYFVHATALSYCCCRFVNCYYLLFVACCALYCYLFREKCKRRPNCFILPLSPITHRAHITHSMEMYVALAAITNDTRKLTTRLSVVFLSNEQCTNTWTFAKWILRDHRECGSNGNWCKTLRCMYFCLSVVVIVFFQLAAYTWRRVFYIFQNMTLSSVSFVQYFFPLLLLLWFFVGQFIWAIDNYHGWLAAKNGFFFFAIGLLSIGK